MRVAGYATATLFSNPYAYYLAKRPESKFDFLPEPTFQQGGMQHACGCDRAAPPEFRFWKPHQQIHRSPVLVESCGPTARQSTRAVPCGRDFEQARELLAKLPDGFFLWVHVMTPHSPYLPNQAERGRFLPVGIQQIFEGKSQPNWKPHYKPSQQSQFNQYRLRYDEFVLTADRAFGAFISELEKHAKLQNTTVVVSAITGRVLKAGFINMEIRTNPACHPHPSYYPNRRVSRMAGGLPTPPIRPRLHPRFSNSAGRRNQIR